MEKLDKHLWAARPPALGPQLLAMYKSKQTEVTESMPSVLTLPPLKVHIEDSISNWGARAESERYAILQLVVLIFLMQKFRQQFFNQAFLCHNNFFVIKLLLYFCLDVVCADFSYLQDFQTKSQDL